jgi:hypothetical protein
LNKGIKPPLFRKFRKRNKERLSKKDEGSSAKSLNQKMKIKKEYYCITDNYNNPRFDLLFESLEDARKKLHQIQVQTRMKNFFSLRKCQSGIFNFAKIAACDSQDQRQKILAQQLRIGKVYLMDNISPEKVFKQVKHSPRNELSFSKLRERENVIIESPFAKSKNSKNKQTSKKMAVSKILSGLKNSPSVGFGFFRGTNWSNPFLRNRALAGGLTLGILIALSTGLVITSQRNAALAEKMALNQIMATQNHLKALEKKEEQLSQRFNEDLEVFVLGMMDRFDELEKEELEAEIRSIVKDTPMEKMAPYIAQKDRQVAAFIVGIGMKESRFGIHAPVDKNGNDCLNYWGYTMRTERKGSGGNGHPFHSCFDSVEEAVDIVGGRIERLIAADINTPQEMVLWKCGSDKTCQSSPSAKKWVSDISIYYDKLNNNEIDEEDLKTDG